MFNTHLSHQHLKDEDAQPPPVHRAGVGGLGEDLRGQELRGSTEGAGAVPKPHPLLTQAKVRNLQVALLIQQ